MTCQEPPPLFFVSVASKGLTFPVSYVESIFYIGVDSRRVNLTVGLYENLWGPFRVEAIRGGFCVTLRGDFYTEIAESAEFTEKAIMGHLA
jgi:hypothetical protein